MRLRSSLVHLSSFISSHSTYRGMFPVLNFVVSSDAVGGDIFQGIDRDATEVIFGLQSRSNSRLRSPFQEGKEEEWWPRWKRRDRDDVAEALQAVRAAEETRQVRKAA